MSWVHFVTLTFVLVYFFFYCNLINSCFFCSNNSARNAGVNSSSLNVPQNIIAFVKNRYGS